MDEKKEFYGCRDTDQQNQAVELLLTLKSHFIIQQKINMKGLFSGDES